MITARRLKLGVLLLACLVGLFVFGELRRLAFAPLPLDDGIRTITVQSGSSVREIDRALVAEGVLSDGGDLLWAVRIWGGGATLKAGEYELAPGTSTLGLLRALMAGRVVEHVLTIVEGSSLRQLRARLEQHPALAQTLAGVPDEHLLEALGLPPGSAEGRFLPDTYRFPRGTTDAQFLLRALRADDALLDAVWKGREPDLPLRSPQQLLTLASIVEKETGREAERAQIAGVFVRRLRLGMRLQTDPTVIYGLGDRFDGNLRKQDLMTDTPYNTYTRSGLPPTPICMPGRQALLAAAHPAAGRALYFVADGEGGHVFSATLEEHNAAVARMLQRERAARRAGPNP